MEMKKNVLTKAGKERLENELRELTDVKRAEIAEKIKEARAQGELSENAEYDAAKNEQADIERRISEIQSILNNAEIASEDVDESRVYVGSVVTVQDTETKEKIVYYLVGTNEVNTRENKVSNASPIGAALMHKKVGEIATVSAPCGSYGLKIMKIQKA